MKNEILKMNEEFNKEDMARYIKSYMFIKGVAIDADLEQTLIALAVARRMHEGQHRKDGTPYLSHPLKVCSTLISYGIREDDILAASLLHDVLEDCQDKLPLGGKELVSEYGISQDVLNIVQLLSKQSGLNDYELSVYFDKIKKNPKALLIKLSDRLHNSQTLYTFSHDKLIKYIRETNMFILPMASYGKSYYPQYTNAISILKSNIYSLNHSMEIITNMYDKQLSELTELSAQNQQTIKELQEKVDELTK
jgi:GTP pyrophosphokinase